MAFKASITLFLLYICYFSDAFQNYEDRIKQFAHIKSHASPATQQQAVDDLIARLLPAYKENFITDVDPNMAFGSSLDKFEYSSYGSRLFIRCTSGVACAMGINHFLKYYCMVHVSWSGDQLKIPKPFPVVTKSVSIVTNNR